MLLEHIRSNTPDDKSKETLCKFLCPIVSIVDGFGHYTAGDYLDEGYDSKYPKFRQERRDYKVVDAIRERQRIHNGTPASMFIASSAGNGGAAVAVVVRAPVRAPAVLALIWATTPSYLRSCLRLLICILVPISIMCNFGRSAPRLASLTGGTGMFPRTMGVGIGMGLGGGSGGGMRVSATTASSMVTTTATARGKYSLICKRSLSSKRQRHRP